MGAQTYRSFGTICPSGRSTQAGGRRETLSELCSSNLSRINSALIIHSINTCWNTRTRHCATYWEQSSEELDSQGRREENLPGPRLFLSPSLLPSIPSYPSIRVSWVSSEPSSVLGTKETKEKETSLLSIKILHLSLKDLSIKTVQTISWKVLDFAVNSN